MKKLIIGLVLVFLIFIFTDSIYATVKADDPYLEDTTDYYIVNQKLLNKKGNNLVPNGAIQGKNDVYYIEYQYEIIIKDGKQLGSNIEQLWMSETLSQEMLEKVFTFEFDYEEIETLDYREHLFKESVTANRVIVTLKVSMEEPETYEIYQELFGKQLSFKVCFTAE